MISWGGRGGGRVDSVDASGDGRFQRDLDLFFAERLQKLLEIVAQTFVPQVGVLVVMRQRERARRQRADYSVQHPISKSVKSTINQLSTIPMMMNFLRVFFLIFFSLPGCQAEEQLEFVPLAESLAEMLDLCDGVAEPATGRTIRKRIGIITNAGHWTRILIATIPHQHYREKCKRITPIH